jgi:branched-chain amino acid transport system substrate-binding protein
MRTGRKLAAILTIALFIAGIGVQGAQAEEPIKIGAFFALSGPAAFIGAPTQMVAEMVTKKINQEGGVKGKKIELVTADTEGEPTKAVMAFKKFVSVDKVVAVVGPTRTGTGMAVKKQVEQSKIPTVMTVGGDPVIMEGKIGKMDFGSAKWVFKTPQRSSVAVAKVLGYLKSKGLTKLGLITASDGFGRDGARWVSKMAPDMGFTIVAKEQFNPRDVDMKSQLTKIAGQKPQAIVCWTIGPAGAIVSKNHHALGLKMPLVQCHGLPGPKYIKLAGAAAEGDLMPSTKLMVWQELKDSDPQKKVIKEFVHLYNDVYHYNDKYPINTHSGYAWDAIMILALAMEKAGTDKTALRDAIEKTKDYVGISGIYNITPKDHNGLGVDSMVMVQVKDGKFVMAK